MATTESSGASSSKEKQSPNPKKDGCYNCGEPHLARNCPKKKDKNVSALVAKDDGDQLEIQNAQVNPMQFLNAITGTNGRAPYNNLMQVKVTLSGNQILTMVDTGKKGMDVNNASELNIGFFKNQTWWDNREDI